MLYISVGKIDGGTAPILTGDPASVYSNPLPHVLILTAIVVGVATTAVGYALIIRSYEAYGTIADDEVAVLIESDPDARERAAEEEARERAGGEREEERVGVVAVVVALLLRSLACLLYTSPSPRDS